MLFKNNFVYEIKISCLVTTSVAKIINGKSAFAQGQCLMDQFRVTSPGNPTPPIICGVNSGEHSNIKHLYKLYRDFKIDFMLISLKFSKVKTMPIALQCM